ncbi:hypothetical protein ACHAQH_006789 [Verticillium albo-atrum]
MGLPWGGTSIPLGPSYPLSFLNDTFYYGLSEEIVANPHRPAAPEYAHDALPVPAFLRNSALYLPAENVTELDILLEKSIQKHNNKKSSRGTQRGRVRYTNSTVALENAQQQPDLAFRLGKNVFETTATEGMGFNVDTFFSDLNLTRLGLSSHLAPRELLGPTYSNNVSVGCYDVALQYRRRDWDIRPDPLALHRRGSFADFDRRANEPRMTQAGLASGANVGGKGEMGTSFYVLYTDGGTRNVETAVQVFFFRPAAPRVIECAYAVSEFSQLALVRGTERMIEGAPFIMGGQCLDWLF